MPGPSGAGRVMCVAESAAERKSLSRRNACAAGCRPSLSAGYGRRSSVACTGLHVCGGLRMRCVHHLAPTPKLPRHLLRVKFDEELVKEVLVVRDLLCEGVLVKRMRRRGGGGWGGKEAGGTRWAQAPQPQKRSATGVCVCQYELEIAMVRQPSGTHGRWGAACLDPASSSTPPGVSCHHSPHNRAAMDFCDGKTVICSPS